jgi:UDP-N-acetylmuramate: L-alanyl-gamma-D-glutamyl-meso-diaminopimelate ligase
VFIYKPPQAAGPSAHEGEDKHKDEGLSQEEIVERVRRAGIDAAPIEDGEDGLKKVRDHVKADDIILLLTSGNMGGMVQSVPRLVEEKFPL